jgi:hypothetical protein
MFNDWPRGPSDKTAEDESAENEAGAARGELRKDQP